MTYSKGLADPWPPTHCSGCGEPIVEVHVCHCHKYGGPHEEDAWCSDRCMEAAHADDVDDWRKGR